MKKSVVVIISAIVAVLLLALCFVFGFNRSADTGYANLIIVDLDEAFELDDVADIMKEAGAKDVVVEREIYSSGYDGTIADIYFTADDAEAVCSAADELLSNKYFLMGDCTLYNTSASVTKESVIGLWPAIIVLAVIAAYVFLRFGARFGASAVIVCLEALFATTGLISVIGLKFNDFTMPVVFASGTLAFMLTLALAVVSKYNEKKGVSLEANLKAVTPVMWLVICALAVACALVAIFGATTVMKALAFEGLVAVAVNALITAFVLPASVASIGAKK